MLVEEVRVKKLKRRGHHGSVTRLIGQLKDDLQEENSPNMPKLRQQRSLLSVKLEILSKLNEEILELTPEDDIEQGIDQADQTKEKVCLTINDIDHSQSG